MQPPFLDLLISPESGPLPSFDGEDSRAEFASFMEMFEAIKGVPFTVVVNGSVPQDLLRQIPVMCHQFGGISTFFSPATPPELIEDYVGMSFPSPRAQGFHEGHFVQLPKYQYNP